MGGSVGISRGYPPPGLLYHVGMDQPAGTRRGNNVVTAIGGGR